MESFHHFIKPGKIKRLKNQRLRTLFLLIPMFFLTLYSFEISAQESGSIHGKVVDSSTGEELIGANILLEGTTIGAATDIEGNFRISNVVPGTYTLIASMIGYSKYKVTDLEIKPGEQKKLDLSLVSEAYETDEVVVTARMILNNEAALLKSRQKSVTISDAIGSDEMKNSGSNYVGEALKKVVGTSVVDGKYVFVRGLGDRYNVTQLNGVELPSSDPNRKSFQMDLIPTNLLDNIVTLKTFTPDKPGNFSGGIVDIGTKSFPEKFTLKFSMGASYNSQATGNSAFLTYPGGETDWLGTDDGTRGIPEYLLNPDLIIPSEVAARFDPEKAQILNDASKSFNSYMSNTQSAPPMNGNMSLALGDQIPTGETSSFGYLGSFTYRNDYEFYQEGRVERYTLSDLNANELNPQLLLDDSRGVTESTWGGLITTAYNFSPEQQLSGNVFYSQSGISKSRYMTGTWPQERAGVHSYNNIVLEYLERNILSFQLKGDHHFSSILNSHLDWSASIATTQQQEPDRRLTTYISAPTAQGSTSYTISGSNFDNPSRYFRDLEDDINTFNLNIAIPFAQWDGVNSKFSFGGMYQKSDRVFSERIFTYNAKDVIFNENNGNVGLQFLEENNGIIDTLSNGRPVFGNTVFDRSFDKNNYTGNQKIYAAYGMLDLPIFRDLRFVGGLRYETTDMSAISKDPTIPEGSIDEADILPSLNLIYQLTESMNLRFAGTQTLARPTFREIAPYSSKEFVNGEELYGNPYLQRTLIQNFDFRWEWFLRPGEIIAVSTFYKHMDQPIERGFAEGSSASNKIITYTNVDAAELIGVEFEARINLDHLVESLRMFSLGFNLSLINSSVDIPSAELENRQNIDPNSPSTRQLQGQSPYMMNIDLTFHNVEWGTLMGLYFNTFGERLSTVSANLTPDIYEQPANILDFTASQKVFTYFTINFSVKNILNEEYSEVYRYKGNDFIYQSYNFGRKVSLGLTYSM